MTEGTVKAIGFFKPMGGTWVFFHGRWNDSPVSSEPLRMSLNLEDVFMNGTGKATYENSSLEPK